MEQTVFILDKIGIFAFAFVGVSHGVKKNLDIFGLLLAGTITAVGGGIMRDLTLAHKPYAISHIEYLLIAVVASILSMIVFSFRFKVSPRLVVIADTLGLAMFAVSGANVAVGAHLNGFVVILFAVMTAGGGGLIREVILNEIPFVLRREIYATAAGIGGLVFYLLVEGGYGIEASTIITLILIVVIRSLSIAKKINLPILR